MKGSKNQRYASGRGAGRGGGGYCLMFMNSHRNSDDTLLDSFQHDKFKISLK
jgi:hypothetical protein